MTLKAYELVRTHLFSTRGKVCITLDYRGVVFNKACSEKFEGQIENVEIIYNPLEMLMLVRPANKESEKTLTWKPNPVRRKNWIDDVMGVDNRRDQRNVPTVAPMDYGGSFKSSAIYYGSIEEAVREGKLNLEQLGKDKFDPNIICEMVKKGVSPKEGWVYLQGMAVFKKNSIMIFPENWSDSFGPDIYHSCTRKQARYEQGLPVQSRSFTVGHLA